MEINHQKTKSVLTLKEVNIDLLLQKINALTDEDWDTEEDFKANYNKNPRSALNNTKHIIFRFSNKQANPFTYKNYSRWVNWKSILLPVLDSATKNYNYKKGVYTRVMLALLPAKSFISPHTDGNETGSIPHKIHIPLQTNENAFFYVDGEKFQLKQGFAYEVNNSVKHAVANSGNTDRVHLIFEYLDYDAQSEAIQKEIDQQ